MPPCPPRASSLDEAACAVPRLRGMSAELGARRRGRPRRFPLLLDGAHANDGCYFHITADRARIYTETWKYVGDYREGIAVVQADDGGSTQVAERGWLVLEVIDEPRSDGPAWTPLTLLL